VKVSRALASPLFQPISWPELFNVSTWPSADVYVKLLPEVARVPASLAGLVKVLVFSCLRQVHTHGFAR
jgi:hypothetical protein